MDQDLQLLLSIGLSVEKSQETLKNIQVTHNLKQAINEVLKYARNNPVNGTLIYHLACRIKSQTQNRLSLLARYIAEEKLNTTQKIDCALEYFLHNSTEDIDIEEFERVCGIGIVITPEEIEKQVEKCIRKYKNEIIKKRYRFNHGPLMQDIRNSLKWADGKMIKAEIDLQLLDLLGYRLNSDYDADSEKSTSIRESKNETSISQKQEDPITMNDLIKSKVQFHEPGQNFKTEGYVVTSYTQNLLQEHLMRTGGKVRTRFPPEPNGILHIGHAKAININFGYAAAHNGFCYLRYDDTNPEKEEEKFVTGILDIVKWLGYEPAKITYSSDYFDILFEWAVCLIKKKLAYVCHQRSNEIKGYNPLPSPWRNRPISESLNIFQDMKNGLLDEGEATLRMKLTLEEGKQDPVAYRIKFSHHHQTSDKWCIYPTYDFTHCLCDSIEDISHSLCTKEFQSRRSSYYWLCNALNIYCPVQWEYGRLNVSYTVVSKRKIAKLIEKKIVNDWDDPRLLTLSALRRRGVPAQAINNFCVQMGVTGAQTTVDPHTLEAAVRDTLNTTAPRCMVVLEPLKLIICNSPYPKTIALRVPNFPGDKSKGRHLINFDRIVYIDSSDFREEADTNFKRLTLNQSVGLKYIGISVTVKRIERDMNNIITNLIVHQEPISDKNKPKAFIHWVSQPSLAVIRTFERLFQHRNPEDINEVPSGFLSDINHKSKKETFAYIDKNFEKNLNIDEKYQFERIGFFSVDPDSTPDKVIFNRAVTLKENIFKV